MSAPTLTPAEQAEVDRFGVHDEEVIEQMSIFRDDEPTCMVLRPDACTRPASHALVCRACSAHAGLACHAHAKAATEVDRNATHIPCGTTAPLRDLIRVVPL